MLKDRLEYFLHSHDLLPLLGIRPGGHLPSAGFGPVSVQGTSFRCLPVGEAGRRKHRIEYFCIECQRWIPFGRANQHRQGVEHKSNAEVSV